MRIGVVSDTHNNVRNIKNIIRIFNEEGVDNVIHTGDVSKAESLTLFSELQCPLIGVFGNNDRMEVGLNEVCQKYNFSFMEPPFSLVLDERKVVIFHEPEPIEEYIIKHDDVDLVLHGHTHRYREEVKKNVIYFNPGESAGFFEGKSVLGIIELKDLKIRRVFF